MILSELVKNRCYGCANARFDGGSDRLVCVGSKPAINELERAERLIAAVKDAPRGKSKMVEEAIGYLKSAWYRLNQLETVGDSPCLENNEECFERRVF